MDELGRERSSRTRRAFLGRTSLGLGSVALAALLDPKLLAGTPGAGDGARARPWRSHGVVDPFHVRPRAKRVIFLYMSGGPSQFETFDYKPMLARLDGAPMPESFTRGQPIAQLQGQPLKVLRPLARFRKYGESGQEISD